MQSTIQAVSNDVSSTKGRLQPVFTPILLVSTLVTALGGLLFGFDTAVIAGSTASLTRLFHLTPALLGFTVSSALIGTIVGALVSGQAAGRYGRRACLRMAALAYLISAVGCALAHSWMVLLIFRVIGGVGIGGSSVLGPMYIAEIAPAKWRGRLVACFQLNIVIGILLAYVSNYLIGLHQFGAIEWRLELGVAAIPAAIFLFLLLFIPHSPRWLVKQNRSEEAEAVLIRIGESDPAGEVQRMERMWAEEQSRRDDRLFTRPNRKPVMLALIMGIFCQLSGINAVLYFLNDIFAAAGYSSVSGSLRGIVIGLTNLLFTGIAMLCIDRFGRRFLLMIGSVAMALTLGSIGYLFHSNSRPEWLLWLLVLYCASFSFSEGAVMWVYISEIFPLNVREKGQSLGSIAHWVTNAIISGLFPVAAVFSKSLPFYFFAAMMVVQLVLVLSFFPETKGRSLESNATQVA
jgi:sugar porter (SP) family MFS transporter